jgi:hypothetical protein
VASGSEVHGNHWPRLRRGPTRGCCRGRRIWESPRPFRSQHLNGRARLVQRPSSESSRIRLAGPAVCGKSRACFLSPIFPPYQLLAASCVLCPTSSDFQDLTLSEHFWPNPISNFLSNSATHPNMSMEFRTHPRNEFRTSSNTYEHFRIMMRSFRSECGVSRAGHVRTCSDLFALVRTCSDLFGLVRTCSDLFGLVRACSDLFGLVRTFSDSFGIVRTCSDLFGLVRTCSDLSGIVLSCLDLFGLVRTCSGLFGLVRTCSDLFGVVWACSESVVRCCSKCLSNVVASSYIRAHRYSACVCHGLNSYNVVFPRCLLWGWWLCNCLLCFSYVCLFCLCVLVALHVVVLRCFSCLC